MGSIAMVLHSALAAESLHFESFAFYAFLSIEALNGYSRFFRPATLLPCSDLLFIINDMQHGFFKLATIIVSIAVFLLHPALPALGAFPLHAIERTSCQSNKAESDGQCSNQCPGCLSVGCCHVMVLASAAEPVVLLESAYIASRERILYTNPPFSSVFRPPAVS